MLKEKYCIPPLDRAYSALLLDLADRGMLDETERLEQGQAKTRRARAMAV
jgi:hypothetical protein